MGRDFERVLHYEKKNEAEGNYKSLLAVFMGRDFERVSHAEEEIRLKGVTKIFLSFSWAETLSASHTLKKK